MVISSYHHHIMVISSYHNMSYDLSLKCAHVTEKRFAGERKGAHPGQIAERLDELLKCNRSKIEIQEVKYIYRYKYK